MARDDADVQPSQRGRMRLSTAVGEFAKALRASGKARGTVVSYESDLRQFLAWLAGRGGSGYDSVLKFTRDAVVDYLAHLEAERRRASTRHRRLAAFKKFAAWGLGHQLWTRHPLAGIDPVQRGRTLPRPFSPAESNALMALNLPPMERAIRAVLFFSGLRVSAVAGLKIADVSTHPPQITYTAKGGATKIVPMATKLKDALLDYVMAHTDLQGQRWVFVNAHGRQMTRKKIEQMTRRWGQAAGVPTCVPHRFRHTFGTELLRQTGNLQKVKEAMGHADVASTVAYTEVLKSELEDAVNLLPWSEGPADR